VFRRTGLLDIAMSHVSVTINGRQYRMACEEGQEDHLTQLAKDLDRRIADLRKHFGEIGDMRLAVMAALMVGDELLEAGRQLRQMKGGLSAVNDAHAAVAKHSQTTEVAVAAALDSAAERIERLTRTLNQGVGEGVALG
jgi:cell division protein ZapA